MFGRSPPLQTERWRSGRHFGERNNEITNFDGFFAENFSQTVQQARKWITFYSYSKNTALYEEIRAKYKSNLAKSNKNPSKMWAGVRRKCLNFPSKIIRNQAGRNISAFIFKEQILKAHFTVCLVGNSFPLKVMVCFLFKLWWLTFVTSCRHCGGSNMARVSVCLISAEDFIPLHGLRGL